MNTVTVTSHQSLFDVAVQHCGSADAAFEMAVLNGVSLTDDPQNGDTLTIPDPADESVVQAFAVGRLMPATGCTQDEILDVIGQGEGIEFWGIEYDFIVS